MCWDPLLGTALTTRSLWVTKLLVEIEHIEVNRMSRLINAPIQVTQGPAADRPGLQPVTFMHRQERHQVVEILDTWDATPPPTLLKAT